MSFGHNTTYTECDQIARVSFIGEPTKTIPTLVTATITVNSGRVQATYPLKLPFTDRPPACRNLDSYHCRQIHAMGEVGGVPVGPFDQPFYFQPGHHMCGVTWRCSSFIDEVILLYWPENVTNRAPRDICTVSGRRTSVALLATGSVNGDKPVTFTTDAITFKGRDLYLRYVDGKPAKEVLVEGDFLASETFDGTLGSSIMTGSFTFTSPTVYLAYRPIYRTIITSPVWTEWPESVDIRHTLTMPGGIIPLNATDVSSWRPNKSMTVNGVEFAQLVANGSFQTIFSQWRSTKTSEAVPLDFRDLQSPVPASVYYDVHKHDCWGKQTHCKTITEGAYRPQLKIADKAWVSVFNGSMCKTVILRRFPMTMLISTQAQIP
jgi:hypothetical protein